MLESHQIFSVFPVVLSTSLLAGTFVLFFAVHKASDGSEEDSGYHSE